MMRLRFLAGSGLLVLAGVSGGGCHEAADTVITGGMVWTGLSSGEAQPGAVAIKGDRIVLVGDSATVAKHIGSRTEVIDAHGGLVAPGFADGHTHFIEGGFQLISVDLRTAATPAEFVRRIKEFAATLAPGVWILGGDWDHTLWPGQPLPRHEWIDSITPNNPVFIERLDGHEALANSAAMKAAGVTRSTPTPPGGEVLHDARGEPTGIFKDQALDLIGAAIPSPTPAQRDSALARALAYAASLGVTATGFMSAGWDDLASFHRLEQAGRVTLRASLYMLEGWQAVADTVKIKGPGDDWVRIGGLKGFMDGSAGSRTAYFFDAYTDSAGYFGLLQHPESAMRTWIGGADSAGLQIAVHAIGDRANAILLAIYDSVAKAHGPRDRRFRVEHAQHLRQEDIAKFGAQHIVPSMQPYHAIDDGRWVEERIGPERIKTTYAFRTLLDTGAPLAFGSDWTVATIDPLWGIYAAVTRRTLDGKNPDGWIPEQKIKLSEALRAYTYGNAWATFNENKWGTLAPGHYADVVVLDHDLFRMPPESLYTARVAVTIAGGKVVYRKAAAK
ncbi:MAG TPA: amidohydrolase [Gemmatimonadales bacterium]|nr:amidohydrolase [Gemmatimonadales bacterium]